MNALLDLAAGWRKDADLLRNHGAVEAAVTSEKHAREVIEAVKRAEGEHLTLAESATASGYSKRRLSELIADETIPNVGRKGAPRIRRGDLPRKAKAPSNGFDAGAEARTIMGA